MLKAGSKDTRQAQSALERLCQTYWEPLYAYTRRRGCSVEDAQDVTQSFFAKVFSEQWILAADQNKGRFRTFLLTAMERFLANEWDKARALKRGGGKPHVPIQCGDAETRYGVELQDSRTPEQVFEYKWALTLLDQVLKRLEADYQRRNQQELFNALKGCLVGESSVQPYSELAKQLGMGQAALKVAVHRMRHRYREFLRAEVAQTLASPEDAEEEMRYLFRVLSNSRV